MIDGRHNERQVSFLKTLGPLARDSSTFEPARARGVIEAELDKVTPGETEENDQHKTSENAARQTASVPLEIVDR